jgi:acyl carrier protein
MDRDMIIEKVHQVAGELAASSGRTIGEANSNLLERYGFTSLDALEFLLLLEEQFGVTFEDEDLSENTLTSDAQLADYIQAQLSPADR